MNNEKNFSRADIKRLCPKYKGKPENFDVSKVKKAPKVQLKISSTLPPPTHLSTKQSPQLENILANDLEKIRSEDIAREIFYVTRPVYNGDIEDYKARILVWAAEVESLLEYAVSDHESCHCCTRWIEVVPISLLNEFKPEMRRKSFNIEKLKQIFLLCMGNTSRSEVLNKLKEVTKVILRVKPENKQNSTINMKVGSVEKHKQTESEKEAPKTCKNCGHNSQSLIDTSNEVGRIISTDLTDRCLIGVQEHGLFIFPVQIQPHHKHIGKLKRHISLTIINLLKKLMWRVNMCEKCRTIWKENMLDALWLKGLENGAIPSYKRKTRPKEGTDVIKLIAGKQYTWEKLDGVVPVYVKARTFDNIKKLRYFYPLEAKCDPNYGVIQLYSNSE